MSLTKRYLEDIVDELAKELNEDWFDVNDVFMEHVSDGLSIEKSKAYTREYFKSVQRLRQYEKEIRNARVQP